MQPSRRPFALTARPHGGAAPAENRDQPVTTAAGVTADLPLSGDRATRNHTTMEPKPGARYPGDTRPPFEPGNTAALRHGARSARVLRPIVERLTAEVADVAPWTRRPAYAGEVKSWAWSEARCVVLREWVDEHGVLSDEGTLAAGELARAESRAATARDRLGLSPLALAKLLGAFTSAPAGTDDDALEALKAEGRRIVEVRADQLAATVPGWRLRRPRMGREAIRAGGKHC
jgi:hypothetical protein